jgi:hypothetical protein
MYVLGIGVIFRNTGPLVNSGESRYADIYSNSFGNPLNFQQTKKNYIHRDSRRVINRVRDPCVAKYNPYTEYYVPIDSRGIAYGM